MRLLFDPSVPHQRAAIDAVLDVLDVLDEGDARLLAQLQAVQRREGVPLDAALPQSEGDGADAPGCLDLSVEMETGTGKTYTYLKTILELARRHGLHKWLIVVPSVAIREGVLATLRDTREHFRGILPDVTYRYWAYDGQPQRVRAFATSPTLEIGVLTIDAFNKISNRLRKPDDRFAGQTPLAWIRRLRPCLVLDEPHHYDSPLSRASLARLHPRLALRYGATHRHPVGLVHRLTPAQACAQGLVKRVQVCAVPPEGDDLARMSAQIEKTIALHVQRQAELLPRGIKVLSLFFVDTVASYADRDGAARVLFDRHFEALKHGCPALSSRTSAQVATAYFATKRATAVTTTGRTPADEAAYQLIMRDKARLLSLSEPAAFVFSHSALREGWDNPNVFQVCTLAPRASAIRRRQEIGRGVRLCVDQEGRRVLDPSIDVLSVVPAERYEDFLAQWNAEHEGDPQVRAPAPSRGGQSAAVAPAPAPKVAWVQLHSPTLLAHAAACLAGATGQADPQLVRVLLARRRPTIALAPQTIAAAVACGGDSVRVAEALASAVAAQGG